MHCLDTNALIDYLEGVDTIGRFLEESDSHPYFAPTIALHEVYAGAARLHGRDGIADVRDDLDWLAPIPLTGDAAVEAALISADLKNAGNPIGGMDTLIAGVVRENGGTLVTADRHFERVDGLDVVNYRELDTGG